MSKITKMPALTADDIAAINRVYNIIHEAQRTFKKEDVLMSPETGEVLRIEELARVKGVLSFFTDIKEIEVNP